MLFYTATLTFLGMTHSEYDVRAVCFSLAFIHEVSQPIRVALGVTDDMFFIYYFVYELLNVCIVMLLHDIGKKTFLVFITSLLALVNLEQFTFGSPYVYHYYEQINEVFINVTIVTLSCKTKGELRKYMMITIVAFWYTLN